MSNGNPLGSLLVSLASLAVVAVLCAIVVTVVLHKEPPPPAEEAVVDAVLRAVAPRHEASCPAMLNGMPLMASFYRERDGGEAVLSCFYANAAGIKSDKRVP